MNEPAIINTDGACSGNPGPGGFAAIIEVGESRITVTGGDPDTTNNRMELAALIEALRVINSQSDLGHSHVTVRSDSRYIVNAFNDRWIESWQKRNWRTAKKQPVANRDLWEDLLKEMGPHQAEFVWVRGHSGDPMNEECDRLAVEQSHMAPSQPGYWTNAGNALTAAPETSSPVDGTSQQPTPTPLSILELAIERNEIVLNTLRIAINLQTAGHPKPATAHLRTTLRHLAAQRQILTQEENTEQHEDNWTLFQTSPISMAIASDRNAKAISSTEKSISMIDLRDPTESAVTEMTKALNLLEEQHTVMTNASKDLPSPLHPAHNVESLLEQTAAAIEAALHSMKQGNSPDAANRLEAALQQLDNHRRSPDRATSTTLPTKELPQDHLPFYSTAGR